MNRFVVRGFLDRPESKSLGMVGLVVEDQAGKLRTEGLVTPRFHEVGEHEFTELTERGDLQLVDGPTIDAGQRTFAALWVGDNFREEADRLHVPLPPIRQSVRDIKRPGELWIGPTQHVWRVIDSWLIRAFRRAVQEKNAELASLMGWALPQRPETRAALWFTADNKERNKNLDWWTRLERDAGRLDESPQKLELSYRKTIDALAVTRKRRVIGLCAFAKGGDTEIADKLSIHLGAERLGFGKWLKAKAKREGHTPDRRFLQRLGQEMIEQHGALAFCLEVLDGLPPEKSLPDTKFVIDGVRHPDVHESLKALVGEDNFMLVFIDRPDTIRRNLLMQEEGLSINEAVDVMQDPTERDIPKVRAQAILELDRQSEVAPIVSRVEAAFAL